MLPGMGQGKCCLSLSATAMAIIFVLLNYYFLPIAFKIPEWMGLERTSRQTRTSGGHGADNQICLLAKVLNLKKVFAKKLYQIVKLILNLQSKFIFAHYLM